MVDQFLNFAFPQWDVIGGMGRYYISKAYQRHGYFTGTSLLVESSSLKECANKLLSLVKFRYISK